MLPDARLIPVSKLPNGTIAPHILTIDGWIDAVRKRGSGIFYERQIKVKSETYGPIAHLWSTYEVRPTPDGKAEIRRPGAGAISAIGSCTAGLLTGCRSGRPRSHLSESAPTSP